MGSMQPSKNLPFNFCMAASASSRLENLQSNTARYISNKFVVKLAAYLTNATPLGMPVILSFRIFFCTIWPNSPNMFSITSSFIVFGRFVTYRLEFLMSWPGGRAYDTFNRLFKYSIPFKALIALAASSPLTYFTKPKP